MSYLQTSPCFVNRSKIHFLTFIADTPTLRVMIDGFVSMVKPTKNVQQTEN